MSAPNESSASGAPQTPPSSPGIQASAPAATPASPTAVQAEPATIPLPPPRPAPRLTLDDVQRNFRPVDAFLVALVLGLAALISIFPVRNSDFWLNLAVGRGIVNGEFGPTDEPFSSTASERWVNHSWLFGVLLYAGYKVVGGSGLVILKGLLVVAVAALMLRCHRRGLGLWVPALTTTLALLAMMPRLLFQPTTVSLLLLAVTFYLLVRRELGGEADAPERKRTRTPPPAAWLPEGPDRALWLLVPLFALWVNLDTWFFLGPLTLALYLLGELIHDLTASASRPASRPGAWRPMAVVLAAGVAACLLNPNHVLALRLPAEIVGSETIARLEEDSLFRRMLVGSWGSTYLDRDASTVGGVAYFTLAGLGLLSFGLNLAQGRWGRFLVWAGLLGLAGYHARAIPFFAVVGAPILALNLQDYLAGLLQPGGAASQAAPVSRLFLGGVDMAVAWLWGDPYRARAWGGFGRLLTAGGLVALLALAWPGWLVSFGSEVRRVGLSAEPDPSLVQAAEQLQQWRREGLLTGNGFNVQPEIANVLAWLTPADAREKGFFDFRLGLYSPQVAEDYVKLRKSLQRRPGGEKAEPIDVVKKLKQYQVSHVIYHDPDRSGADQVILRAMSDPGRWVPLHLDGRTAIYAVLDGSPLPPEVPPLLEFLRAREGLEQLPALTPHRPAGGPFSGRAYDPARQAFGPAARALPETRPIDPGERRWWEPYVKGAGSRPATADEARMLVLSYFRGSRWDNHYETVVAPWGAFALASMVGHWGTGPATLGHPVSAALNMRMKTQYEGPRLDMLEGPLAPAVLAVRRAREALHTNPYDARTYLWLGLAYQTLRWETAEWRWGVSMPQLWQVRQVQAVVALRNVLRLEPDPLVQYLAHDTLAELYRQLNYFDLSVKHMEARLKLSREIGPLPDEDEKSYEKRLDEMEKSFKGFDKDLKNLQNDYAVKSSGKKVFERASLAARVGLAEQALNELLNSDALDFGIEGTRMQLDLLLSMGDTERLKFFLLHQDNEKELRDSLRQRFNAPIYETYRYMLAAAEGNYVEADQYLVEAMKSIQADDPVLAYTRRAIFFPTTLAAVAQFNPEAVPGDIAPARGLETRQLAAAGVAMAIARGLPEPGPVDWLRMRRQHRDDVLGNALNSLTPLRQESDLTTLRGVLAVEAGNIDAGRSHFRQALYLGTDAREPVLEFGGRPLAQGYLALIEKQRK